MDKSFQSVKLVLRVAAIVTLGIGLFTMIFPSLIVSWFDGYSGDNFHFIRFVGTALIGFSLMNWVYSKSTDITVVLPALYGNLVSLVLAIIIDGIGLLIHALKPMAWIVLVVHMGFAAAFLYSIYQIKRIKAFKKLKS